MAKTIGSLPKIAIPLVTLGVLLVPFIVYDRYYSATQETYVTERGFRALSVMGGQIASRLNRIEDTIRASATLSDGLERLDYLSNYLPESTAVTTTGPAGSRTGRFHLRLSERPGRLALRFDYRDKDAAPTAGCQEDSSVFLICGQLDLDDTVRTLTGDDSFDDVVIVDSAGRVYFERATAGPRITDLGGMIARIAASKAAANPKANPGAAQPFSTLIGSSVALDGQAAGDDYRMLLEPLQVSMKTGAADTNLQLVLCGLIRQRRIHSESALPYPFLIWGALIALTLMSLIWPLVKINFMSPTERLGRRHLWSIGISMFTATVLMTLMVLNASFDHNSEDAVDQTLRRLATSIQVNVAGELTSTLRQLAEFQNEEEFQKRAAALSRWDPSSGFLAKARHDLPYPFFDLAFWADAQGTQRIKLSVAPEPTPRTDVSKFPFFSEVLDNDKGPAIRQHLPTLPDAPFPYRLQPVFSPNTGQFQAVLAAPYSGTDKTGIAVQVIVTTPMSLVDPVLPPGYNFAILDRQGGVLFHSNRHKNLVENFIDECENKSALKAALFAASDVPLEITYEGAPYRAYLTTIKGIEAEPSTLIVFHDSRTNRTANLGMILVAGLLLCSFGALLVAAAIVDLLRRPSYPPKFIWPQRDQTLRYLRIVVASVVMTLAFVFTYQTLYEIKLLAATFAVPILAGVLSLGGWAPPLLRRAEDIVKPYFRIAYASALVSILTVAAVVPCFGFFKFSYDAVSELWVKRDMLIVAGQLKDRRERISKSYENVQQPLTKDDYSVQRLGQTLDRYDRLLFGDEVGKGTWIPSQAEDWFDAQLAGVTRELPSNEMGAQMSKLYFASKKDDRKEWAESGNNQFLLHWFGGQYADFTIVANYPPWAGLCPHGPVWFTLMWLGLGLWTLNLLAKVFLTERETATPLPTKHWTHKDEIRGNYIVLGPMRSGKSERLLLIEDLEVLDLRAALETRCLAVPKRAVVAVDHFEFNLDDDRQNEARLELLEDLVYRRECRVLLITSVDPLYYFAESHGRWTRLLSSFEKIRFAGTGADGFEAILRTYGSSTAAELVRKECVATGNLRALGLRWLDDNPTAGTISGKEQLASLLDHARGYYALLWDGLTRPERLALFQLAKDGWANPQNREALVQLAAKGLIYRDVMLRVMNQTFRHFILSAPSNAELAEWLDLEKQSSWRAMKQGLIVTLIGFGAWMLYSQRDLFQMSLGFVVTLGGAITAIMNVLGTLTKAKAGK